MQWHIFKRHTYHLKHSRSILSGEMKFIFHNMWRKKNDKTRLLKIGEQWVVRECHRKEGRKEGRLGKRDWVNFKDFKCKHGTKSTLRLDFLPSLLIIFHSSTYIHTVTYKGSQILEWGFHSMFLLFHPIWKRLWMPFRKLTNNKT